jgi:hypothetical protein
MKKYSILSMILLLTVGYAQNKATEKADKLFESYQYIGAIDEYLKLADSKNANQYIYTQLAESYYNVFNTSEASKWYAKATQEKNVAEIY